MALHLKKYIEQTTLPAFPFARKVNYVFLDAMLKQINPSDYYQSFEPGNSWVFLYSLSPILKAYSGSKYRDAILYAIQHHNVKAVQYVVNTEALGSIKLVYGVGLHPQPAEMVTDVGESSDLSTRWMTDQGLVTDDATLFMPVLLLLADCTTLTGIDVPTKEQAWKTYNTLTPLISVLKPARIQLAYIERLNFVIGRDKPSAQNGNITYTGFSPNDNVHATSYTHLDCTGVDGNVVPARLIYNEGTVRVFEFSANYKIETALLHSTGSTTGIKLSNFHYLNDKYFAFRVLVNFSSTNPSVYPCLLNH